MISKKSIILIFSLLFSLSLHATTNQKIYSVDSQEFSFIKKMYLLQGHSLPSATGPWSSAELRLMLDKIDADILPDNYRAKYQQIFSELNKKGEVQTGDISFNFDGELNGEFYIHRNTEGSEIHDINYTEDDSYNKEKLYTGRKNWFHDLTKITPFFRFNWETFISDYIYSWFEFPLQNTFSSLTPIGSTYAGSNIVALQTFQFNGNNIDLSFPQRAFIAFGNEFCTLQFGRDRLNWGNGTSGNLMMSDNLPFHNMLRFTTFSPEYKYTFLVSAFPYKSNFYYDGKYHLTTGDREVLEGISFYIGHRIEGRFFNDKFSAILTESVMYCSQNDHLQWETLNPVNLYHNTYTAATNNSILGLEFDYTPFNGLNFYTQFILDELQLFGEDTSWPNALGHLWGVNYYTFAWDGILSLNLEAALTDPYTYLRYCESPGNSASEPYGLDFIVAQRLYSNSIYCRAVYEEFCLGYKYGPDVFTGNLNASWEKDKIQLNFTYFFMAKGTHDFWTIWEKNSSPSEQYISDNYITPTVNHESSGNRRFDASNRDSAWFTNVISVSASYQLLKELKFFTEVDFVMNQNAWNNSANAFEPDLQIILGVYWKPF